MLDKYKIYYNYGTIISLYASTSVFLKEDLPQWEKVKLHTIYKN